MDDPLGEVAHIYELNGVTRRSRRKHFASPCKPCRPISEPPRRILRSDDQTCPANKGALTHGLFARDLGSTIGFFSAVLDLRCGGCPQWRCVRPLPGSTIVRIDTYR